MALKYSKQYGTVVIEEIVCIIAEHAMNKKNLEQSSKVALLIEVQYPINTGRANKISRKMFSSILSMTGTNKCIFS